MVVAEKKVDREWWVWNEKKAEDNLNIIINAANGFF